MANRNLEALTDTDLADLMNDLIDDGNVPGAWREIEACAAELHRREAKSEPCETCGDKGWTLAREHDPQLATKPCTECTITEAS